jgi:lauroyl/myristoyl acyltransferase
VDRSVIHLSEILFRQAERFLPIPLLLPILWPAAVIMGRRHVLRGSSLGRLRRLPPALRPAESPWQGMGRVCLGRSAVYTTRMLSFWPERLREDRWRRRCEFLGIEHLDAALATGRPVILATLHYGDLTMLYHWLRSRGLAAAFMAARRRKREPEFRRRLDALADQANGLEGVPHLVYRDELWDARDFLDRPGRVLAMAVDGNTSRDVAVTGPGYAIRVAPGALRLATITGATILPCLISSPGCLRSTIRFGRPVPDEDVTDRERHPAACEHIVRELIPWIAAKPEECGQAFLANFDGQARTTEE